MKFYINIIFIIIGLSFSQEWSILIGGTLAGTVAFIVGENYD